VLGILIMVTVRRLLAAGPDTRLQGQISLPRPGLTAGPG